MGVFEGIKGDNVHSPPLNLSPFPSFSSGNPGEGQGGILICSDLLGLC